MRRIFLFALLTFTLGGWLPAAETLSKDDVLRTALRDNQTLKAARAKWEAMKQRIPQEKAWEDLNAGLDFQRASSVRLDRVTDVEYMLSQAIPVSGKNLSRGRVANAEALSAFESLRRAELDLVSRVQQAYFRLSGAYGQLDINRRNQELLKDFTEISRRKFEVGTATQSDVLLAQTELARLSENEAMILRDISDQQTQLNVLMNRSANSHLAQPEPLHFSDSGISANEAMATAASLRPEVLMAARDIEVNKARLQLAHRQWIPDPQVQIKAREFAGSPGIKEYDTGIFFSLPWANPFKYSAGVKEAQQNLANTQHQYTAAQTEVTGLVRDQLRKIDTFATTYHLYHEQIGPTAELTVSSTRSGYETDKNTFLELLTAQRNFQLIESSALNQLVEHQAAVADLDAIIGKSRFLSSTTQQPAKRHQ